MDTTAPAAREHGTHGRRVRNLGPALERPRLNAALGIGFILVIAGVQLHGGFRGPWTFADGLTGAALGCAIVAACRYPVHIHRCGRVYFVTASLYLLAIYQPVPLGAAIAFVAAFIGWVFMCRAVNHFLFAFMTAARWSTLVLVGSLVAHGAGAGLVARSEVLVATAALMWALDLLTIPLAVDNVQGASVLDMVVNNLRSISLLEVPQYLIAILGAAAAEALPWSPVLLVIPIVLLYVNGKRTQELQNTTQRMLEDLADTVDLRDPYTGGHSRRVTEYVTGILDRLNIEDSDRLVILSASRVHDIGKIGVPDSILNKAGLLTDEERAAIQEHAPAGARFLARYKDFASGVDIVRHHHESWDGTGYPDGLAAYDIPLGARIVAVADSYDAMTSDRPYRSGMTHQQAVAILQSGRNGQWDAELVDAFIATFEAEHHVAPVTEKAASLRFAEAITAA